MLGPVIALQSLRYFFAGTLHTTVAELCQLHRITLTSQDRIQNRLPTGSGEVAQYVVNLQVHLAKRLLHMQDVLGGHLQQTGSMPPKGTHRTDVHGWAEAGPQQSNRVQILNPLAIGDIGTQLAVGVQDLQDMHNDFRQKMDSGLQALADNQGKKGMPASPAPGRKAVPEGTAEPDRR